MHNKPASDKLVPPLHILLDEFHVQEGSMSGPYETGCVYQMVLVSSPHQESARICTSVFPIHQHPTQKSAEENENVSGNETFNHQWIYKKCHAYDV